MSEVRLPIPVKATLVADLFADGASSVPGAFMFWRYPGESDDTPPAGLHFSCPCGCEAMYGARFRNPDGTTAWTLDGNREAPTVSPSLGCYEAKGTGFHWHGYLSAGFFTQA